MLKFSFRQQVFAGFAASVFLVLLVGVLSYKSINQLESDSGKVEHTQKVIQITTNLLQLLIDAETGMRGYIATNKTPMLDPYYDALPKIKSDIEQLHELVQESPLQVRRADSLSTLVNAQLNILKTNIEVRPIQGLDYMVNNNMLTNGKHNMDDIRSILDHIRNTEDNLLAARKTSSKNASSRAIDTIIVGSTVFLVIIVLLFYYIQLTFERQKKIENETIIANAELERVLAENKAQNWLLTGTGLINDRIQGQQGEREGA